MSRQILVSKTIAVLGNGNYYKNAFLGMPGTGNGGELLTATAHFCNDEFQEILSDLGLPENTSPSELAEMFSDDECLAIAWAISPKPLKCTETESITFRLLEAPEAAYLPGTKADKQPIEQGGADVENATNFKELFGRMPLHVVATKGFRKGVAISVNGRTYDRKTESQKKADPNKVIELRMRNADVATLKNWLTDAAITVDPRATDDDIKKLVRENAAKILG